MAIAYTLRKCAVGVVVLGVLLGTAYAASRLEFPGDFPGPPYYSYEFNSPGDGLVAIHFIRDPDCIPDTADLLGLDFGATTCALTVHGYVIRSAPPPAPPEVFHAQGDGDVPVWLVSSSDLAAAVADGVLHIGELESAPSLVRGTAHLFVVHEEVPNGVIQVTSRGDLEDGRSFSAKLVVTGNQVRERYVTVR